ncbi:VOC family protein [Kitasatospora sp. NPDC048194]|uniref:VOC family protein n=1 Tax=Kitasatospora sp. NPDC048194 TaxID=3364045 RepID=UPI00372342FB
MPKAGRYHEGVPCWVVLTRPDVTRAQHFYGALFDWDFVPTSPGEVVATRHGAQVAAIVPASAAEPAAWITHLACGDLNRSVVLVRAHGGRITREPYQVPDQGRAALAVDPLGAPFGLWQGDPVEGSGLVNEPGTLTWNEHLSPDPDAARLFYRRVFGYGYDRPRAGHTLARAAGLPACGIGPVDGQRSASWRTHFATADTDRAADRVRALGGSVLSGPEATPFGRSALVRDDADAEFVLVAAPAGGAGDAA